MPRAFNSLSSRNKFAKRHYEAIALLQSKKLDVALAMATTITTPSPMWSMNCAGCSGVTTASLVEIVSIGLVFLERM